jgi:hypothetical protein
MTFKVAFFKGPENLFGNLIRLWELGPYSHCEMIFSDGMTGAATAPDGVTVSSKHYNDADWDYIYLPLELESYARAWFEDHKGKAYDYTGDLHFVLYFIHPSKDKWFCSRAVADALGWANASSYGPNKLARAMRKRYK